jgi:uridine phosphorylase
VAKLAQTLRARGYECQVGTSWTTDAPYRETREEVQHYQSEGADTVEMESAALLALGQVRNVQTAAVVVVGDSLAGLRWQAPSDVGPIERALEQVYAGSIEALDQA